MTTLSSRAIVVVLVLSAGVRLWGTFENPYYWEDEAVHVPSAMSLGTYGTTRTLHWVHPPLGGLLLYGSISALGNNPYGWRLSGVLLGTASVGLLYLVGACLFPGSWVPLIAAALLGLDPFHAYFSRTSMVEIPATFFFLLYLYLMLEHGEKGRRTLPLAGVAMGLTIATKAYFVLAIPIVAGYAFHRSRQRGGPVGSLVGDYALTQLLLPISVFLFSYVLWFGRGFTFPEFVQMQLDALRTLRAIRMDFFGNPALLAAGGQPWEWFLKPILYGTQDLLPGEMGRFYLKINNPPFRLLVGPALAVVGLHSLKQRSSRVLLGPVLFAAVYLVFVAAGRPIFAYSALAVLPLAYLVLAHAVTLAAGWRHQEGRITALFLGLVVLWGAYTFPVISGRLVAVAPYRPLLEITTIWRGG